MSKSIKLKAVVAFFIALVFVGLGNTWACELCKKNQPKVLDGITHGAGPEGNLDYFIIWIAVVVVGITLALSLKFLINPNENNPHHIKNIVLDAN
jgi:hypothetical protein